MLPIGVFLFGWFLVVVILQDHQKVGAIRSSSPVWKLLKIFHMISHPPRFKVFFLKFNMFTEYFLGQVSMKMAFSISHFPPSLLYSNIFQYLTTSFTILTGKREES